jgi:hypothetical protein
MSVAELISNSERGLSVKEAFPNPLHRLIYYGITTRNVIRSVHQSRQEANALMGLRNIPGIIYDEHDRARIKRVEQMRREEVYAESMEQTKHFILDHNLGSVALHSAILEALDD